MKSKQIFKASELAKQFPVLAPCVDHRDFIHVAMVDDVNAERYVLISYIWDTREVTQTCCIEHGCDEYDAMAGISSAFRMSISGLDHILADDNLTMVRLTAKFDFDCSDYLRFLNEEVFTTPIKVKLTSETSADGDTKFYYINGQAICETTKGSDYYCKVDRHGRPSLTREVRKNTYQTDWNWLMLRNIFGQQGWYGEPFKSIYPDLRDGFQGRCLTKKEVKAALQEAFHVVF